MQALGFLLSNFIRPSKIYHREAGFSLVELMVAVGIMGSLSVMAVPAYGRYQVKAAQAEVKTTLASVHTAAELFFTEEGDYEIGASTATGIADLGITLSGDAKYEFLGGTKGITANGGTTALAADASEYCAALESKNKLAGCATKVDKWNMNQKKEMSNTEDKAPCASTNHENGLTGC